MKQKPIQIKIKRHKKGKPYPKKVDIYITYRAKKRGPASAGVEIHPECPPDLMVQILESIILPLKKYYPEECDNLRPKTPSYIS